MWTRTAPSRFVISPYIKRGAVDHRFYNTDSVLHTHGAIARPAADVPVTTPTRPLFAAFGPPRPTTRRMTAILPARSIIAEINSQTAYRASDSARLDFSRADRVPDGHPERHPLAQREGRERTPSRPAPHPQFLSA